MHQRQSMLFASDRKDCPQILTSSRTADPTMLTLSSRQAHTEPLRRAAAEECADLFMDVGDAYAAVGRPGDALGFYGVLAGFPAYNQPALWLKMGQCAALVGDYEGAVEKLRRGGLWRLSG